MAMGKLNSMVTRAANRVDSIEERGSGAISAIRTLPGVSKGIRFQMTPLPGSRFAGERDRMHSIIRNLNSRALSWFSLGSEEKEGRLPLAVAPQRLHIETLAL